MSLVGAVSVVALTLSATVAGAAPWSPKDAPATTWSQTRWVAPGDSKAVTVQVGALPENASQATFRVVQVSAGLTRVAVCAGSSVTTACKNAASAPARLAVFTKTVDLTGADRQITLHSTAGTAQVTVSLTGYTTSSPTSPPSESATPEPDVTDPQTPATSEATATETPTEAPDTPQPAADWPGASNTGVPAGTKLQTLNPGGPAPAGTSWEGDLLRVRTPGTVLDSYDIRGMVRIDAKNVVIKNSKITGQYLASSGGPSGNGLLYGAANGSVTVQDSEIYAASPSVYINGVVGQNFTLERVDLHGVVDQVVVVGDNVTVRDSWLHANLHYDNDPAQKGGPSHDDNVQVEVGRNITLEHNRMESSNNAALQVTQNAGQVGDVRVARNHISGGGCSINLAQKTRGALQGFVFDSNVFTRTQGYAGCAVVVDSPSRPNLTLTGNVWLDGQPISVTSR